MKNYTFEAVCATGVTKTFTCEAVNFAQARELLSQFVAAN
jgi:hypothetical protein